MTLLNRKFWPKKALVALYGFSLIFQMEILPANTLPIASRLYYFLTPLGLVVASYWGWKKRNLVAVDYYLFILFLASVITAFNLGLNTAVLMAIYCLMAYLLGQAVANTLDYISFISVINKLFVLVLAFYLFRLVFNLSEYIEIVNHGRYAVQLNSKGESPFLFIASGGWNAEICLLGILSTFIIGSRVYRVFLIFFIAHVLLFESRVGMIIMLSHFLYSFKVSFKSIIRLSITLILLALVVSQFIDLFSMIVQRFNLATEYEILEEGHGRLFLWGEALELVNKNPYGHGIGVGIEAAQSNSRFEIPEPNFHNIYLQILVDIGVFGLISFISVIFFVLKNFIRYKSKVSLALVVYLLVGFFQFTGYDIFIWFIFGLFVIYNSLSIDGTEKSF